MFCSLAMGIEHEFAIHIALSPENYGALRDHAYCAGDQ
jgi:hypothetical protein